MIIKVCGMRDAENIRHVENLGIDLMGFIFYPPSPRYVDAVPEYLPKQAQRIGVFVNETKQEVLRRVDEFALNGIQLHGKETPSQIKKLRACLPENTKIIKALSIANEEDILKAKEYQDLCDMLIFDTKCPTVGGSGVSFDWFLLDSYKGNTPFLLSGGIGIENCEEAMRITHPKLLGFDLNSRFEISPAFKDISKLKLFIEQTKKLKI